ncbi:TorF family putative porin [uncultured Tateyamaria sp.]|uniref:TorF family putative porin n=1 Tax=uncultured Tateyamaria sp. TaxID=455651 RepID=UPI002621B644|nr:TorF family putative porin [uncultured Tateyamaria sp.]
MLKRFVSACGLSALLMGMPAMAEDDAGQFLGGEFSANIAIATDYTFRGISQNSGDPAVSGGIDWASDLFYVGTWASTVDFNDDLVNPFTDELISDGSQLELDLYFGYTPSLGDLSLDFGFTYYLYPGAPQGEDDIVVPTALNAAQQTLADALGVAAGDVLLDFPDQNYVELKAGGTYPVGPAEIGFNLTYSPDYYFETGDVLIPSASLSFPIGRSVPFAGSDLSFAFSGQIGYLAFIDNDIPGGAGFGENYWDFGAGVTATWFGVDFDARYIDTFSLAGNGSTGIFTVSKSF